jgi:DNA-binding MarR family transcriptional regulator
MATLKSASLQLAEITHELFSNCNEKETRYISQFGVSIVEAKTLRKLNDFDSLTVNQLANELRLTSSRITRIIDSLVDKGLVLRESDKNDRRVYNLSLSKKGKVFTKRLIEGYEKIHEEILENIPEKNHEEMLHALRLLNDAVVSWLKR